MTDHEGNRKDGIFYCTRDQSLLVLLYHYMPTVNKIEIHNK